MKAFPQIAEKFPFGTRRFALFMLPAGISTQAAQMLFVQVWVKIEQLRKRLVAAGDKSIPPRLDRMQGLIGGQSPRLAVGQMGDHRLQAVGVHEAHTVFQLTITCAGGTHRPNLVQGIAQLRIDTELDQFLIAEPEHLFGQSVQGVELPFACGLARALLRLVVRHRATACRYSIRNCSDTRPCHSFSSNLYAARMREGMLGRSFTALNAIASTASSLPGGLTTSFQ